MDGGEKTVKTEALAEAYGNILRTSKQERSLHMGDGSMPTWGWGERGE